MKVLFPRWSLAGVIAAVVLTGTIGCSDSSTEPKETPEYPNEQLLISGAALEASLAAPNQVIIDVRADSVYNAGHVPGAINIPMVFGGGLFDIGGEGTDRTDLKPASEIAAVLGTFGVSEGKTIIVYGVNIDPLAGRLFWMLEYLGASKVKMLDGGFAKWSADSRQLSTTAVQPTATTFTPNIVAGALVSKEDLLAHYNDTANYVIVDSRNANHFVESRIPHAVNLLVGDFLNADLTMKPFIEVEDLVNSKGVTRAKKVYTHCYVGYRSSQGYFIFRVMGYDVAHYDGSWDDWNADPKTPKASGL